MIAVESATAACVLSPIFLIAGKYLYSDRKHWLQGFLFSLYLSAVCSLVGLPNITYIRLDFRGNLIPFGGLLLDLRNSVLNVLLFVPLGCMLPLFWKAFRSMKRTLFFGIGLSVTIELLQLFTYRATDVNDLITNFTGTLLGFLLGKFLLKSVPSAQRLSDGGSNRELTVVCLLVMAVMFCVQPLLSAYVWNLIL